MNRSLRLFFKGSNEGVPNIILVRGVSVMSYKVYKSQRREDDTLEYKNNK